MTQTPSAARSIVTAVGPRPTSCCPGFSSDTGRMYSAILRRVRRTIALLALLAALLGGCGQDGERSSAPPARPGAESGPGASGDAGAPGAGQTPQQDPPAANERLPRSSRRLAARATFVSGRLRAS